MGGYHIFQHNALCGEDGRRHLFKGVAIILSPMFYQAWHAAGSLSPITTNPSDKFAGRIIYLKLRFTSFDDRGKCIKGKYTSIALMSVYFPCNDRQHDRFCSMFNSVLANIDLNTQIIVGSDKNARIGTWTSDKHKQVLGPYGIARSNTRGKNLVHILGSNNLKVKNMFSIAGKRTTSLTPVFPPTSTPKAFQACTTSLHARNPSTSKYMTAKQFLTELAVITKQ